MYRLWLLFSQVFTVCAACVLAWQAFERDASAEAPAARDASGWVMTPAAAVERAAPSVVTILTHQEKRQAPAKELGFEWPPNAEDELVPLGSGVVIREGGYIVTNHHVVDGARTLVVTDSHSRSYPAKLVGYDIDTDLALLKAQAALPAIVTGDSEALKVGDPVLALGNPFGVGQTVTSGIVSALGRHGLGLNIYEDFIQTDASINQGNSGGALVNSRGELVGINSAIFSPDASEGFVGIGFAIPTTLLESVLPSLMAGHAVVRGYFGFVPQDLTPTLSRDLGLSAREGVLVKRVLSGSPAEHSGLRAFDVVVAVDGRPADNAHALLSRIARLSPGAVVDLEVKRGPKTLHLKLKVSSRPTKSAQAS